MALPDFSCPCCNVDMPIEVLITHQGALEAFVALADLHPGGSLHWTAFRYVGLFAAPKRKSPWPRIADLFEEVRAMVTTGRVSWKGQELAAPIDYWLMGMNTLTAKDDLRRPLANHNLLRAVVAGYSDQVQHDAEKQRITQGRGETPIGAPRIASETAAPKPTRNPQAAIEAIARAKTILSGVKNGES